MDFEEGVVGFEEGVVIWIEDWVFVEYVTLSDWIASK